MPVESLPDEVMGFVMPSRFCLPDELGHEAWQRFGHLAPGWSRVQAIVDFVHGHLTWVAGASNPWTTAADAYRAGQGVCRDYAHLAITFCRALNIPARYVFGYIPDIEAPPPTEPMDFAAWFEAYLDGRWHTFDARNNTPRVGRVVVGRGRDAVDVALITSFGPLTLTGFSVHAERARAPPPRAERRASELARSRAIDPVTHGLVVGPQAAHTSRAQASTLTACSSPPPPGRARGRSACRSDAAARASAGRASWRAGAAVARRHEAGLGVRAALEDRAEAHQVHGDRLDRPDLAYPGCCAP